MLMGGLAPRDLVDLVDADPIELGDLRPRHPLIHQSSDATELGCKDVTVSLTDSGAFSPRLRFGGSFVLYGAHRRNGLDRYNARLSWGLLLGRRRRIGNSRYALCIRGRPLRLKEFFGGLAGPADPFAIIETTRRVPVYQHSFSKEFYPRPEDPSS